MLVDLDAFFASVELFQSPEFDSFFDLESARKITHGLDFSGEPVE